MSQGRGAAMLAGAIIAAAALIAYANTLSEPFVFDTAPIIARDAGIRHLWPVWNALMPPHDGSTVEGRPILNLSLAVSYALSGTGVLAYHLMNLAIHLLAGLVLFGLVRRTLLPPVGGGKEREAALVAGAAALLWTVHPLQTEAVTYVIQRAESLMGLFYLLTLYCFIRGIEGRAACPQAAVWFTLSCLCCLLGMGTKEVMVSAPLIVLLYDRTFVAGSFRAAWRARRGYYLSLAATWIFLACLVAGSASRHGTAGLGASIPWFDYLRTQAFAIVLYLRLAFWPHPQVFDYGAATLSRGAGVVPAALLVAALLAATLVCLRAEGRRARIAGFLGAGFFLILAPTSLVPVATQTIAEHRMYLPLAAVSIGAVLALRGMWGRRTVSFAACVALAALALGVDTLRRNEVYRSEIALWSDTVAHDPANARAHNNLGNALYQEGSIPRAQEQYEEALALQPKDNAEAEYNLGTCLLAEGRFSEAIARFRQAVRLAPENPDGHNNLGNALAQSGRLAEAALQYEAALRLDPAKVEAHYNLGNVWALTGRPDRAAAEYRRALSLDPGYADARAALERLQGSSAP